MSSTVDKTLLQKSDVAKRISAALPERRDTNPEASPAHHVRSGAIEELSPALEHRTRALHRSEQYTALNESIAAFHLNGTGVSTTEERAVFAVLERAVHARLDEIQTNRLTNEAAEELSFKLAENVKGLSTIGLGELHTLDSHQVYNLVQE
jgi:hypothetical protein